MPRRRNQRQQRSPSPEPESVPAPEETTSPTVEDVSLSVPAPSDIDTSKHDPITAAATADGQGEPDLAVVEEKKTRPALDVLYCEGVRQKQRHIAQREIDR